MSGGMGGGEAGVDPPTTTKGDLSGFDTTFDRVPIGADTQILTADSTEALGLKWAAPTASGVSLSVANTWTAIQTFLDVEITGGIQSTRLFSKYFEEYFTGNTLGVIWTLVNTAGSGSASLTDGIDNGVTLATGGSEDNKSALTLNNIRHFDLAKSTFYCIVVNNNLGRATAGLSNGGDPLGVTNSYSVLDSNSNSNFALQTGDGSGISNTVTDITKNTNVNQWKIISNGTNVKLFAMVLGSWVLKVTKTTNLPTGSGQPAIGTQRVSSNPVVKCLWLRVQNDD
tara:strand:+ start:871 stop:1722 length:852 start_codon:yes stop_codon:yes gene_type:complete